MWSIQQDNGKIRMLKISFMALFIFEGDKGFTESGSQLLGVNVFVTKFRQIRFVPGKCRQSLLFCVKPTSILLHTLQLVC